MVQKIYMDENKVTFQADKAQEVRKVLRAVLAALLSQLEDMNA